MRYISTRGQAPALGFADTMLTGLARDGGLYVPESVPRMNPAEIEALAGLSYEEVALRVMRPFVGDAFTTDDLAAFIERAYADFAHPARAPLVQLAANHFLLELFHGPTLAFKDFAMQLIGQLFAAELERRGSRATIIGATSGDTGAAAIEAFRGLANVDVFILFPEGRVSEVQRRQMTTPDAPNVHALAVEGTFDDCQASVKAMFADDEFRDGVNLAAVNSINWVRVLAQVVYYFTAAVSLGAPHRPVRFTVPTGNFGDIYAGHVARAMGLPVARLVVATNSNDILHRCLTTGEYRAGPVMHTISPSMDIQVSSNFERTLFDVSLRDGAAVVQLMDEMRASGGFHLSRGALARLRELFVSGMATEEQTTATIARIAAETGHTVCPHTAVGIRVAEQQPASAAPMVTLATAHPAKFPDAVEAATGARPALPDRFRDLHSRAERVTRLPNSLKAIQSAIREGIRP